MWGNERERDLRERDITAKSNEREGYENEQGKDEREREGRWKFSRSSIVAWRLAMIFPTNLQIISLFEYSKYVENFLNLNNNEINILVSIV